MKPRGRSATPALLAALLAAQRDAGTVEETEPATSGRWHFAPAHLIEAEAKRLMNTHGLLLLPVERKADERSLHLVFRLVHVESGEEHEYTHDGPLAPVHEHAGAPQAVTATERNAWRTLVLRLFSIREVPVQAPPRRGDPRRGADGLVTAPPLVVPQAPLPAAPPFTMDRLFDQLHAWCEHEAEINAPAGGGRPKIEDAWARCCGTMNQPPIVRMPIEGELEILYWFLREQAETHGYAVMATSATETL